MLVPGGGLAADGRTWMRTRRRRFLVPVKALGLVFRAIFARLARRAVPGILLPESIFRKPWVVFAKPAVHGADNVLEYLGRYVHRTALSDKAIVALDDKHVTFSYRRSADGARKQMRLPAFEFLRRFLQHVPPRGFHRVRAFGLLHPAKRATLRRLQLLLACRHRDATESTSSDVLNASSRLRCPHCHQPTLTLVRRLTALECATLLAASQPPQPSIVPKAASP
jgi:hypothetical protein